MRTKSDSAADGEQQASAHAAYRRAVEARTKRVVEEPWLRHPLPLLVDERPSETDTLSMSIAFNDGELVAVAMHGVSAARMRRALLELAAEQGDKRAQCQLAELERAESSAALAAEAEVRRKRRLLTVK
jgi:hypothetical protein